MELQDLKLNLQVAACSTGRILFSAKLYILECSHCGKRLVLGYYLNEDDAKSSLSVHADLPDYSDFRIDESLVWL